MQLVNGGQFLNISFLYELFASASATVILGIVPLASMQASL